MLAKLFEKISFSFRVISVCFDLLIGDLSLLLVPLFSFASLAFLVWALIGPVLNHPFFYVPHFHDFAAVQSHKSQIYLVILSFLAALVSNFFSAVMIVATINQIRQQSSELGDSFSTAIERIPQIFLWTALDATIGMLIRSIGNRKESSFASSILESVADFAWRTLTLLALPIVVMEESTPIEALAEAGERLKKTWGEQIVSNWVFGEIFALVSLIPVALFIFSFFREGHTRELIIFLGFLTWFLLWAVFSALQSIYLAFMYEWTAYQNLPEDMFPQDLLLAAVSKPI